MNLNKKVSSLLLSMTCLGLIAGCQNSTSTSQDLNQSTEIQASKKQRPKQYFVKINLKDKQQATELVAEGIDLFGAPEGNKVDALINDKQAQILKQKNVTFTMKNASIEDTGRFPGGYHSVDQVLEIMKDLNKKYPDLTEITDIGDSWEKTAGKGGGDIVAFTVTNKKATGDKKSSVFLSGVHSRELVTVEVNMRFMDMLLKGYGTDKNITNYLDTREVVFIPLANIDGRRAVEKGESMWRKNRHIDNTYDGIDLNRNFAGHWNFDGVPMTPTLQRYKDQLGEKDSDIYSGPSAFSEPETQAINKFLTTKKPTVVMDLHSYGNMIIYPPGYTNSPVAATPTFKKVASVLASKNKYRTGTSMELLYPTCGTSKDWAYDKFNAISFTMEMGNNSDGFNPPFSRVDQIWNENKDGLLYLVSIADNPMRIR
ncbi:MAG: M14 family metallopeptidase [Candidatus Sericytochromatia bacterium]